MKIKTLLSREVLIPESLVEEAIMVARSQVKIFHIKKKSGGNREIFHPSKKLKTIQYWMMHRIFNRMPLHDAAMAYRENVSILDNAKKHSSNRYFLRIDLKDFFPSISFTDLLPILREWHLLESPEWDLDEEAEDVIKKACFYKNDRLAIGYPSSPVISNIVMSRFDREASALASLELFGKATYTRYADDLVFSTNKEGACSELKSSVEELILSTKSPDISINTAKTKIGSSSGGSASVTGLKVCKDGHITIHRKQKDHVRLMLSLFSKNQLKDKDEERLLGHIAYCRYVAPQFFTSISKKYFKEIDELQRKVSSLKASTMTSIK
jgi:RNA-directed DNA polymerase